MVKKSEGDTKLGEITTFDSLTYSKFDGLSISYSEGEEKHLLIVLDLKLKNGEMAQIQIGNGKVQLDTDRKIVELPVTSKEFKYECAEGDLSCQGEEDDDTACTITSIDGNSGFFESVAVLILAFFFAVRFSYRKN